MLAETLRFAIERGVSTVNLSTGIDVSKTRWRPTETAFTDVVVVEPGARARLAYGAFTAARRARAALLPDDADQSKAPARRNAPSFAGGMRTFGRQLATAAYTYALVNSPGLVRVFLVAFRLVARTRRWTLSLAALVPAGVALQSVVG